MSLPNNFPVPIRPLGVVLALSLCLIAALLRFWLAPQLGRLPEAYSDETRYLTHVRFRETLDSPWERFSLIGRRIDHTLVSATGHSIIQGDMRWVNDKGVTVFETNGVYGVDRESRMNLPGYGNLGREGLFVFPAHVERTRYTLWDPMYIGPRTATFKRDATIDGLPIYVFQFVARGIDESEGYRHLPDVPERYRALTYGAGEIWVEPVSGVVVDYADEAGSYFVEHASQRRIGHFYSWTSRYTPETKAVKLKQARERRRVLLLFERWLPLSLLTIAPLALVVLGRMPARDRALADVDGART